MLSSRILQAVSVIGLVVACGPKIRSFVLTPRNVCRGAETTVTWDVSGTPALVVRQGRVSEPTSNDPDTLTLLLTVRKGTDSVVQLEDVLQYPASFDHTVAVSATREGTEVVGRDTANPASWPASFVIQSLRSTSGRSIAVRHGDRSTTLAANGSPSVALQGLPLAGAWELRAPIGSTEVPDLLTINASVKCVP